MPEIPPETLGSTRQDAPQVADGPPDMARGTVYPTMHSFPGLSQPPVALLPNGTFCAIPPFALGAYGPSYAPTFQGHSTIPTPDLARLRNNPGLLQRAMLNNALLRHAASATALQLSRPAGQLEPPAPVTFQPPLTTMQPEPPSSSDRQQGQQPLPAARQGLGLNKPPKESGQVRSKGRRVAHVAPAVHPQSNQTIDQVRSGQNHSQATRQDDVGEGSSRQSGHVHGIGRQPDRDPRVVHVAAAVPLQSNQTINQVGPGQNHFQAARRDKAVEKHSELSGPVHRTDCQPDKDSCVAHVAPAVNLQSDQTSNQVDHSQDDLQAVQQDNAAEKLSKEHGQVDREDHQPDNGPCTAPAVHLQSDQTSVLLHPLERNFSAHTCMDNPESACARTGTVCLDSFHTFVRQCSTTLSFEQISGYVFAAMFPEPVGEEQPVGQVAEVDVPDAISSNTNTPSGSETASPSSSTVTSSPTAVHSSPTGSSLSAPEQLQAAGSPQMSSTGCSIGKRQRSEDCSGDRPQKQQRMDCADIADDRTQASVPPEEKYEYICRICMIHAKAVAPLPCQDELRRHIESMHEPFLALFDYEKFNILKPQRSDRYENLVPLIRCCIPLQLQAQQRGVAIPPERDLTILYPHITAFLNHY